MKIIHGNVHDPHSPGIKFFKPKASDTAQSQAIHCSGCDNCDLFKKGSCALRTSFGAKDCPYGRYERRVGPTKRARGYYTWIREEEARLKGVPFLTEPKKKLAIVGIIFSSLILSRI